MSALVSVAVPVPLRQVYTYKVPEGAPRPPIGSRIAVMFHGRKLASIVVAHPEDPPPGIKLRELAGLLESEPIFNEELLAFLCEAAHYYAHPIGEVLKAASPAIPKGAFKRLRKDGFLDEGEELKGRAIATEVEMFVRRTNETPKTRLGAAQQAILDALVVDEEVTLSELRALRKDARKLVRRLVELGLAVSEEREVIADPFFRNEVARDGHQITPTTAQRTAIERLTGALDSEQPGAFLLHGVTGSGKTEVYLRAIAHARRQGKGSLLIVPEIALTPQLVSRFRARFGDAIAVLHSGLTPRERDRAWRKLRDGTLKLAVGARSALFAPIENLGVVVVDEEHDPSYKQEEGFRYHARDMALLRAHRAKALCILGSATPSMEAFRLAERGRIDLLSLPKRATANRLPSVELIDLKRNIRGPSGSRWLSAPLHRALEETLEAGEQAILFLNRRGFSPSLRCETCGAVAECPACSVALTEHRAEGKLRCHYCDHQRPPTNECPTCRAKGMFSAGIGTEQLEELVTNAFPEANVARLDRDSATNGRAIEDVLDKLRSGETNVLVGTQMVTKGHDIPGVTLVGVIMADQSLGFPDFRAGERTFQLLAQVAGRAGRGERPGRVLIQTFQPEHPSIVCASEHDYETFYQAELADRESLGYPPFGRAIAIRVDDGDENRARQSADRLAAEARRHPACRAGAVAVKGPAPAPLSKLRGRYRFRFLVVGPRRPLMEIRDHLASLLHRSRSRVSLDMDPVSMM